MKKIVPDPPRPRLIHNHYFVVEPSLLPSDALVHASELMSGLIEHATGKFNAAGAHS